MTSVKVNYIYSLLYQILNLFVPFLTIPYLSRVLGSDGIGVYSYVNANMSYFAMIGSFGIAIYSQIEVAKRRNNIRELKLFCIESFFTRLFTTFFSVCLFFFICFDNNEYNKFYLILLLTIISSIFDFTWICQHLENFKIVTIRNSIVKIAGALLVFLIIRDKDDLVYYFMIQSLTSVIAVISIFPQVKDYLIFRKVKFALIIKHLKGAFCFFYANSCHSNYYYS